MPFPALAAGVQPLMLLRLRGDYQVYCFPAVHRRSRQVDKSTPNPNI